MGFAEEMFGGLTKGMKVLIAILSGLAILLISVIIYLLFIGVLNYSVQNNNIPVSSAVASDINDTEADFITYKDLIVDNLGLIIGLVALVVVIAVLGFMLWKKGKSGSTGMADF